MKLATTTEDFAHYAATDAERVRLFQGTGFRHLDYNFGSAHVPGSSFLGAHWMDEVRAAGKAAEQLGFDFVQAHAPCFNVGAPDADHDAGILATIRSIEACGYLGIPNMVIHTGCFRDLRYPADQQAYFERNKQFLSRLIPYLEKHNVNLLIENSSENWIGDAYFFFTPTEMREFVDYFNHPLLHICWDTGHANTRGTDPYQDILALGNELKALHVQDNYGFYDEHIAPFMGTLPLDSLMQGLLAIHYQGYFTFESSNMLLPANSWPHARRDFPLPAPKRLENPTPFLKQKAVALLYEIGKTILDAYDCFEE